MYKMRLIYLLIFALINAFSTLAQGQLIPCTNGEKWGYCNTNNEVVIDFQYDETYPFFENRALVFNQPSSYERGLYLDSYFINRKGEKVIKLLSTSYMFPVTRFENGVAWVQNYQQMDVDGPETISLIDTNGVVIAEYDSLSFSEEFQLIQPYAPPFNEFGCFIAMNIISGKLSLIFNKGKKLKELSYSYLTAFGDGHAVGYGNYNPNTDHDLYEIIDSQGNVTLADSNLHLMTYQSTPSSSAASTAPCGNGLIAFVDSNQKHGYLNYTGKTIIPAQFDYAHNFSEGLAVVGKKREDINSDYPVYSYGYVNTKGELVIPFQYLTAADFKNGWAEVYTNDSIQFIDRYGKVQLSFYSRMEKIHEFNYFGGQFMEHGFNNGYAVIYKNGNLGLMDKQGKIKIPAVFNGYGVIGPATYFPGFEAGIARMVPANSEYIECYMDTAGQVYYHPQASILSKTDRIEFYSAPDPDSIIGNLDDQYNRGPHRKYRLISRHKKKYKINNVKGNFLKVQWFSGAQYYMFSVDSYEQAVKSIKAPSIQLRAKPFSLAEPLLELPQQTVFYLTEAKDSRLIGKSNKWVEVIYYGPLEMYGEPEALKGFLPAWQLELLEID